MITREVITGLLIPLIGTAAGSFCVYFMKEELNDKVQKSLTGFASGVMTAASVWSLLTVIASSFIVPVMPYTLSFAAGAMMYVVVEELIPEMSSGHHSNIGVVMFSLGFIMMMALDVALG